MHWRAAFTRATTLTRCGRRALQWTLGQLQNEAHQIEGVWFTGGITDLPRPTFTLNTWATMAAGTATPPDFVLRRADGKHLVVEIKRDSFSPDITADLARLGRGETRKRWKAKSRGPESSGRPEPRQAGLPRHVCRRQQG